MRLLYSILILGVAAWLGYFIYQNPGDIQLTYQDWIISIQPWALVVGIVLIIFVLAIIYSFFAAIYKTYRKIREWITGSTLRAVAKNADQGWLALAEGDWARAEACLLKAAKHSDNPVHYYLDAAKAAQELGALDRRDNALRLALRSAPEAQVAISLTQAELYFEQGQLEHCLATLQELCKLAPHNILVLQLSAKVFLAMAEWQELIKLLPQIRKYNVLPSAELIDLEAQTYSSIMQAEVKKSGKAALLLLWDDFPKNVRQQPLIVQSYVQQLLDLGAYNEAEQVLRYTLKKQWDINLVRLYGLTLSTEISKQIATAESWLQAHLAEPALLLTLARLCLANKLWGKARSYLDASLALEANADAYAELGRLLGFLGEQQKSLECYKKGLLEFASVLPIEHAQK